MTNWLSAASNLAASLALGDNRATKKIRAYQMSNRENLRVQYRFEIMSSIVFIRQG
jgi:hypothetical protein